MARPSKPIGLIVMEGKTHLTQAEIKKRAAAEASLLTGTPMRERAEVKADKVAHGQFIKLLALLKKLGKNDAIYESVVNRYCKIYSESITLETQRDKLIADIESADRLATSSEDALEFLKLKATLIKQMLDIDRQLQSKRTMLFAIEKENIMTIAGGLRSVPKKEETPIEEVRRLLRGD